MIVSTVPVLIIVAMSGLTDDASRKPEKQPALVAGAESSTQITVTVYMPASKEPGIQWKLYLDTVDDEGLVVSDKIADLATVTSKRVNDLRSGTHTLFLIVYGKEHGIRQFMHETVNVPHLGHDYGNLNIVLATIAGFLSSSLLVIVRDALERRRKWQSACQQVVVAVEYLRVNWRKEGSEQIVATLMEIDTASLSGSRVHELFSLVDRLENVRVLKSARQATEAHRALLKDIAEDARRLCSARIFGKKAPHDVQGLGSEH